MRRLCRRSGKDPEADEKEYAPEGERVEVLTGEMVCVRRKVDLEALRTDLQVDSALLSCIAIMSSRGSRFRMVAPDCCVSL